MVIPLLVVLLLVVATPGMGQVSYLANGDFDAGVSGWGSHVQTAAGSFEWDPNAGSDQAGSLRIDATWPTGPQTTLALEGSCIPIPDTPFTWELTANVRNEGGVTCAVLIAFYGQEDCSEQGPGTLGQSTNSAPSWVSLSETVVLPIQGQDLRAMRPIIGLGTPSSLPGGAGSCWFDDVELLGPQPPAEIPTLDSGALVLLAVLLACFGLLATRVGVAET